MAGAPCGFELPLGSGIGLRKAMQPARRTDGSGARRTTYTYAVTAFNTCHESVYSNQVAIKTK